MPFTCSTRARARPPSPTPTMAIVIVPLRYGVLQNTVYRRMRCTVTGMVVWERPEPPERPVPAPLSRERIVRAALGLADAHGLEAVSLRKVAAALGVGPMRPFGIIGTEGEMLDPVGGVVDVLIRA